MKKITVNRFTRGTVWSLEGYRVDLVPLGRGTFSLELDSYGTGRDARAFLPALRRLLHEAAAEAVRTSGPRAVVKFWNYGYPLEGEDFEAHNLKLRRVYTVLAKKYGMRPINRSFQITHTWAGKALMLWARTE